MRKCYTPLAFGKLLLLSVLLLSIGRLNAQTDITIGTGTAGNTTTTYPCPFSDWWEGHRQQYLYLASELQGAGMGPGNINSIKFNVQALTTSTNAFPAIEQLTVKVGTSSTGSLSATNWETVSATVYGPFDYLPVLGFNTLTFTSPFFWNGTDNLIIELCGGDPNNASDIYYTNNSVVTWTTGLAFNGSRVYAADNGGNLCGITATTNGSATTTNTNRPNIVFNWTPASACSGMPIAGTAVANPTTVCLGQPVSLSATGVTVASGLAYQWQVSTDNVNFNNISGATTLSTSTSQSITSYYRFRVVCTNTNDTAYTASVQVNSPPLLAGNYLINQTVSNPTLLYPNTNVFASFNAAYDAIKCGILDAVVFDVVPGTGPYNEQLLINGPVGGASPVKTITFKGNGNTIGFASSNTNERAVIKLKGSKYFIFDSLTVDASAGTYGFGFHLMNDADSNIIRKCTINSSMTSTSQNYAGIVISGADANAIGTGNTLSDYNIIDSNTINGGYYGITNVATFSGGANGYNEITHNIIRDFYQYGIYFNGCYLTLIEHNKISRPTRTTVGEFDGIYSTGQSITCTISKNTIFNGFGGAPTSTAAFYGIYFNSNPGLSGSDNIIVNNEIYGANGNGAAYGMSCTASGNIWYLHNTVSMDYQAATTTSATRGFQHLTAAGPVIFYNNLITVKRGGAGQKHCIYLGAGIPVGIDYNDYYINSATGSNYLGFYTTNRATLADWQAALASAGQEINSISIDPVYTDPANGNYAPGNAGMDNKGIDFGIPTDILDMPRTAPDIGAYEFVPPPCSIPPVNGTATISATTVCQNIPVLFNLNIGAFGSGQTFQWESASNINGPYTSIGTPMLTPDTTILSSTTLYYRCAVRCFSAVEYSDTVLLTVNPAFPGGVYTIDNNNPTNYAGAPGANFNSFNDAKNAMSSCGILGAVVFNVVPGSGPYNEQLILDSIRGVSDVNTIKFNGNGRTITFNPTLSNERAVIKLRGADHITFDSLTIDASGGVYGYGVQLINNADSNTFRRCTILANSTVASSNYAGIVINATDAGTISTGNTLCDSNTFDKNIISGGYYGITVCGVASAPLANNRFINNTIQDFYSHGIYIAGTQNNLVEGNLFSRPTRTAVAPASYAIQVTSIASNGLMISKNRFRNFFGSASTSAFTLYGIHYNSAGASAGGANIVSNNLFYDIGGEGPIYALYNVNSANIHYYHNTIALDDVASTSSSVTAGFYQTSTATGIDFVNNIITIKRGGTGLKHALYFATSTSEINSNHNDLYVNAAGGSNKYVGYYNGANLSTLAQWQAVTTQDANSFSDDPVYTSPATGDFKPNFLPLDNQGVNVGISTDILNVSRSVATPDIGAFEFTPPVCTGTPVAGTATVNPNSNLCLETPIVLDLIGNSPVGTITFQWQNSPTGLPGSWVNLGAVQYVPQFSTMTTINRFYRCVVACNGSADTSSVAQVNLAPILLAGTYTIDWNNPTTWPAPGGTNFNSFTDAVNALLCGITGKITFNVVAGSYNEQIRIPYIPNTSTINTVTFQSANGNAASVDLSYSATSTNNYTVKLDSAKYFIFKSLTISATNTSFGRSFELAGGASYDSLLNCIINAPAVTSTSNNMAGVFANQLRGVENVISGNTINNGAAGIYFAGTSAANLTTDHKIENNIINGAYYYGIYTGYNKRIKLNKNTVNTGASLFSTAFGIYATDCDSSYEITANKVNINNATTTITGIQIVNCDTAIGIWGKVAGNTITASTGNTGTVTGLYVTNSPGINVVNNVIAINTSGSSSYGLYNNNSDFGNYWNNSVNSLATSTINNFAAYFVNSTTNNLSIRNNIFSHKGGGRALFVTSTLQVYGSDYNMLYTTGSVLAQRGSPAGNFATLKDWKATYWDVNSIGYDPAFVSNTDLQPALANPDVWAMHGRGVQIPANNYDINNNPRPTTLTTGVPDLGAYEFYPTSLPTVLTAIPATPAPNTTQAFMYGTDTVMKFTWKSVAPPSIEVRRYSGVVPTGLVPGTDSMYFYTKVDIQGGGNYDYDAKLFYINPWQGSIPSQYQIGLGKTTPGNAWIVGFSSATDVVNKVIEQNDVTFLDRFTGLVNPYAPPVIPDKDSSNRGRRFWVGYGHHQQMSGANGGSQEMRIYLSAQEPAFVQIKVNGTTWVRNYIVPANSVVVSDLIPKTGADDARLLDEGLYDRGISITSDVPIEAYAHIYSVTNSGATMLMPVGVYGYEYYSLNSAQYYASDCYSWFYVVADNDNTLVEITPSVLTKGGRPAGVPFTVSLNKGQIYQVMGTTSGSTGTDVTGSLIKSIPNSSGNCYPIAVFSGSSRTAICYTTNGDNYNQQVFPYKAWGKRYAAFATANATSNTQYNSNLFRVMVKDPTTVVMKNGVQLPFTDLIDGRYYQFYSTYGTGGTGSAIYIEASKPVMLGQYMVSSGAPNCPGVSAPGSGDPEMIYVSPIEQGITKNVFYSTIQSAITSNYVNVVIPAGGLTSLTIDGSNTFTDVFDHPFLPGYKCVRQNLPATNAQHVVQSDSAFTAIAYGLGSAESYGYNAGTLVRTLNATGAISNTLSTTGNNTEFTCAGSPFKFKVYIPLKPITLTWKLSAVPNLTPNADVTLTNPVPSDSVLRNGTWYYEYTTPLDYNFSAPGVYPVQVEFEHPDVESCDHREISVIYVQVLPAPVTDFTVNFNGCAGDMAQFVAEAMTQNGLNISSWEWLFHDNTTATGQNTTFTYPSAGTFTETLKTITPDGCVAENTQDVVVNPRPTITIAPDSVSVCSGTDVTFSVQNPDPNVTYSWFTSATGGVPVATGASFTITAISTDVEYYVEGALTAGGGCASDRKRVVATVLPPLASPAVAVTATGPTSVTFTWTAVAGATSYQVSVDGGAFVTPSSGTTGLTHTISGLTNLQSVSLVVKALGVCQEGLSSPVSGCSNAPIDVTDGQQQICSGTTATFNVQSPGTGITYTWYDALTGGSVVGTGASFTTGNISSGINYYVEGQSTGGCISSPRTRVEVVLLPALGQIIAVVDSFGVNTIRFRWNPVPGAVSYEVSTDGGTTFTTPSSGPTGLTHTVTGLQPFQEVTLIVRAVGAIVCQASISAPVTGRTISDEIYIPNTFTPNDDGLNDQLRVYSYAIQEMHMMIFNQWGEKIFETRSQNIGWDGKFKGRPQPSGVYIYVARFILRDGTYTERKGSINLIR